MADKKPARPVFRIRGIAVYPKVNKPDFKFKDMGQFSVKLRVSDAAAVAKLEALVEEALAEAKAEAAEVVKASQKKGKRLVIAQEPILPYHPVVNDYGDETGETMVKAACTYSWKDKKTGEVNTRKLPLVNAKNQPTKAEVWSGSDLVIAFTLNPWANPKAEWGVSLRLEGVQVRNLVTGGQRDLGFEADEDGYDGTGEEDSTEAKTDADEDDDVPF